MSKIASGLATIAAAVAVVSAFVPGGQAFAVAFSAASAGLNVIAAVTASQPFAPPNIEDVTIGTETPFPYAMGRTFVPGNRIYLEAHGAEVDNIENPYLTRAVIYSGAGPIKSIDRFLVNQELVNFDGNGEATGYYTSYLFFKGQTGTSPEPTALTFGFALANAGRANWGAQHKLSGFAAGLISMRLDDKEQHYASGVPDTGVVGQWVSAYDPRKDGTYPGGFGNHRINNEATWEYTENPYLHALTYAYGRKQNGKAVCGGHLRAEAIDIASFVAGANVADINNWKIGGVVFEEGKDGEIWNNLKLILQAGGGKPTNRGGVLSVIYPSPKVTLDAVNEEDIFGSYEVSGMRPWRDQINSVIPQFRSEQNDWKHVPTDIIQDVGLAATHGEDREKQIKYEMVTSPTQARQLGAYDIWDTVELTGIKLTLGPRFIPYNVGDALLLNVPSLGLNHIAEITQRSIDLSSGLPSFIFRTNTAAKHAWALGLTGTAPTAPALVTNEVLDGNFVPSTEDFRSLAISTGYALGVVITSAVVNGAIDLTVAAHTRHYGRPELYPPVSVPQMTVTVPNFSTSYYLYYDDETLDGTNAGNGISLNTELMVADALLSDTAPHRHFLSGVVTPDAGGTGGSNNGGGGGGGGGGITGGGGGFLAL